MDPIQATTATTTPPLSEYEVMSALTAVIDPELGLDVISLGLVYMVEITPEEVKVTHTLTSPGCPMGAEIAAAMIEEVTPISGDRRVETVLTFSPPWGPDSMTDDAKFALGF